MGFSYYALHLLDSISSGYYSSGSFIRSYAIINSQSIVHLNATDSVILSNGFTTSNSGILTIKMDQCLDSLVFNPNIELVLPNSNDSLLDKTVTQLIFDARISQGSDFNVGDIIVSDIHDNAPRGYLRKVLSRQEIQNRLVLTVEQASITDLFESASISFEGSLSDFYIDTTNNNSQRNNLNKLNNCKELNVKLNGIKART